MGWITFHTFCSVRGQDVLCRSRQLNSGAHLRAGAGPGERRGACAEGKGFSLASFPRTCRAPLHSGSFDSWAIFSVRGRQLFRTGNLPRPNRGSAPRREGQARRGTENRLQPRRSRPVGGQGQRGALPPPRDRAPRVSRGRAGLRAPRLSHVALGG